MGINHGGTEVSMPQSLLHQPDVLGLPVEVGGGGMTQGVRVHVLGEVCLSVQG